MVKIRLTRVGAKGRALYRIVVMDERQPTSGRPLEQLGTFDPHPREGLLKLDASRVRAWVDKGAQLTPTVRSLLQRAEQGAAKAAS